MDKAPINNDRGQSDPVASTLYQYAPLKDDGSVRVLTLLPSPSIDSDLRVKLSAVRLDECVYDALSYTWATKDGDSSLSSSVFCDGARIKVTKNCEHVLQKLRRHGSETVLWVDAICIDQSNDEERSSQVALMDTIYTRARQVLIWLGDASETIDAETGRPVSDMFFDHLHPMAIELQRSKSRGDFPAISRLYAQLAQQAAEYVSNGTLTPLVRGFLDVVLRPWWERVWVVQEAALGRSAVVFCGGQTAGYDDFYDLFFQIYADPGHESGLAYSLLEGFKHQMYSVYLARECVEDLGPAKALYGVLGRSRRLRATDARDHVFALLNIFGDFKAQLPVPNYKRSKVQVFTDMTLRFVELRGDLDILLQATNVDGNADIPSWVTDWSQRPQFHIPPTEGLYRASGGSTASYSVSDDSKELRLRGKFVDVLLEVPKVDDSSAYKNPYVPSRDILGYQQSCRVGLSMKEYPTGEDMKEVLWRTLCWNVDGQCRYPAESQVGIHFDKFHKALVSGKEMKYIEMDLLEKAAGFNDICVHSMPLGTTSNGYLTSIPWTAEKGDRIAIFAGGEVPFVLRRDLTTGQYRLIGSSYIHGMMNGEVFPSDEDALEWITIR